VSISLCVLAASTAPSGCVGRHTLATRNTAGVASGVAWFAPAHDGDGLTLDRWRRSVGPPVVVQHASSDSTQAESLTVVSWNTAVGAGDIARLVAEVRRQGAGGPIVLLLQEVYRSGPEVPTRLSPEAVFASRLAGTRRDGRRDEIEAVASVLGMNAYYVPSMRNGGPGSDEDRGNAILSTLPLSTLTAFELPFERQRRVAVGATVHGVRATGEPWSLRLVSAHLDNLGAAKRLWLGAELGRVRQTRGLIEQLADESSLIVGGDFNTWFGFADRAFRETARAFPATRVTDRRATFRGLLRLDHLFFRLPSGWTAAFRRADDSYGSDHYPLIATIDLPAAR
jgi:endonuclease/exonuclease/phosphatase family metal-dependent hydrolase